MQKVLLITYFFPPGNFAGSYRMKAWAEHLHKFGYHPIVITRHWKENETDYTAISEETEITKEEQDNYTVYRLPYKGTLRDRLVKKYGDKAKPIGKVFSFFQLIAQNYFLRSIPYSNFYDFARRYLIDNPDIKIVLTSGRYFHQFKFCYLLKKEFPNIEWVADYRDPWTSLPQLKKYFTLKMISYLEKSFEKKWVSNAAFFTTCSEGFVQNISTVVDKKGYVVTNGFENFIQPPKEVTNKEFTICYIGTLYPDQKIETFLDGFKKFISENTGTKIKLIFWGLFDHKEQSLRIERYLNGFEDYYIIKSRVDKNKLIENAQMADCFLLCGIPEQKGRHTAKFFDYLSMKRPILLCPSDHDVLEQTINETRTGFVLNQENEVAEWLENAHQQWENNGKIPYQGIEKAVLTYTYENQVKQLSNLLFKLH